MSAEYRIEMKNVEKRFGGICALKNVNLRVKPGEIHCFVGENGAGKSTLMKILAGTYKMDSGTIYIDGKEVNIDSPRKGKQLGIGIVYQEVELVKDLTVAENIFMESLDDHKWINWQQLYREADEIVRGIGFEIDSRSIVDDLSVAYQQIVEIAKVVSKNVKVLILDEPTALLNDKETQLLFEVLARLKDKGVSIIYISHRLEEIFKIGDTITTLRDGEVTGVNRCADVTMNQVIELMIGRELSTIYPDRNISKGEEALRIENFSNGNVYQNVSFAVHAGEVLGLAGLVGSGRSEVALALFGADRRKTGKIYYFQQPVNFRSTVKAVRSGIALIPESRKEQGLVPDLPIKSNMTITNIKKALNAVGLIAAKKENSIAAALSDQLQLKAESIDASVGSLSGGNQQKVVIAKWFNTDAKVIIMDEPTRGVDIGTKVEIYRLINDLATQGYAIIMISSEMMELMGMCDRLIVMNAGKVKGELPKDKFSEKNIMQLILEENTNE